MKALIVILMLWFYNSFLSALSISAEGRIENAVVEFRIDS